MKQALIFIRTTIVGGLLVIAPIVLLILLVGETMGMVRMVTDPVAEMIAIDEVVGIGVARLLSILFILLLCFAAGLVLSSKIGASILAFTERSLLNRIPGYPIIKGLTTSFAVVGGEGRFTVASINLYGDGTHVLGFIVDEIGESRYAVYVPNSPNPASGMVYFVPRDRVERLAVPMGPAVNSLFQWGVDSANLFKRDQ